MSAGPPDAGRAEPPAPAAPGGAAAAPPPTAPPPQAPWPAAAPPPAAAPTAAPPTAPLAPQYQAPPAGHVLVAPSHAGAGAPADAGAERLRREALAPPTLRRAAERAQPQVVLRRRAGQSFGHNRPSIGAALRAVRGLLPDPPPSVRVRRRVRAIGLGRLLCWELAAAALVASIGRPRSVTLAALTAVACTVAATTVRIRGRLLYEWLVRAGRYLVRRHRAQLVPGVNAAEDLVDHLADHPSIETVDLDGIPVAFIHQADGIATVLELQIPDELGDGAWVARTSVASLLPAPDPNAPPFAAKLIMQTTPAPNRAARSRDANRRVWITVQAERSIDTDGDDELSLALANAVQRMIRRLAREDVPTRTFDRDETLSLVAALSHLDTATGTPTDTEPVRLDENWASWQAGSAEHACFLLRRWPDADDALRQQILRRLHLIPSRGTTIAVAARRQARPSTTGDDGQLVVRITESDRVRLENSASLLAFAFEDMADAVGLERLDGDHVAAVAGSLPLNAQAGPR